MQLVESCFCSANSYARFNSINVYQNKSKIKLFLPKIQSFRVLGAPPPDLHASGGWGFVPGPPASGG